MSWTVHLLYRAMDCVPVVHKSMAVYLSYKAPGNAIVLLYVQLCGNMYSCMTCPKLPLRCVVCLHSCCVQCVCVSTVWASTVFALTVCVCTVCASAVCVCTVCVIYGMYAYSVCICGLCVNSMGVYSVCIYSVCVYSVCICSMCVCSPQSVKEPSLRGFLSSECLVLLVPV